MDRKLLELVPIYQDEIETVRDRYNEERSDPPVARNIPPVAGRVLWIRQLHKQLENPMHMFKSRQRIITHERMQRCIRIYNALTRVFVHYERIYYKAWFDSSEIVSCFLHYNYEEMEQGCIVFSICKFELSSQGVSMIHVIYA